MLYNINVWLPLLCWTIDLIKKNKKRSETDGWLVGGWLWASSNLNWSEKASRGNHYCLALLDEKAL